MIYLSSILLFLAVLVWDVISDVEKWEAGKPVKHGKEARLRMALLSPSVIMLAIPIGWYGVFFSGFLIGSFYLLIFDGLFNRFRGFNWWFLGSNDPDDAKTDNFFQSIPHWLHISIKLFLCALSLFAYLKILL